jgi:hypothetical protein
MSKDNTAGGGGKTGTEQEEEEFVIIETDDSGKPLNQQQGTGEEEEEEEHDDADDQDDDRDDDHDDEQRMGHAEGDQDETPEERRARRAREQRAKRVRNRVTAEAKDRLIQNQGRMLLNLQEQVAKLQGRTVQYDVNLLQSQLSQVESQQSDAKSVLAKLVKAGDGEGVAEITELQMQLRDQHRQITEQLKRAKTAKKGPQADDGDDAGDQGERRPQARGPAPDPEVVSKAQAWASKHKWADPRKGDPEEVQIVRAIDHNLHQEGWDPRSDDYWAELTSRVKRRLPQHFKKAAPNGDGRNGGRRVNGDNGGRPAQGGPRMAPASQSGGGSRPLGKNEVRVTPDRKKAMQDAGMWDDPKKRNRMLAQYAKYDRENAGQ